MNEFSSLNYARRTPTSTIIGTERLHVLGMTPHLQVLYIDSDKLDIGVLLG